MADNMADNMETTWATTTLSPSWSTTRWWSWSRPTADLPAPSVPASVMLSLACWRLMTSSLQMTTASTPVNVISTTIAANMVHLPLTTNNHHRTDTSHHRTDTSHLDSLENLNVLHELIINAHGSYVISLK